VKHARILMIGLCLCLVLNAGVSRAVWWSTEPTQLLNHLELITQYAKQLEQWRLQLQQYEDQIRNTLAPAAYIWDQARQTMGSVLGVINTVRNLENLSGSLDAYLYEFQDVNYYRSSPCFGPNGCTDEQLAALRRSQATGSYSRMLANNALIQNIKRAQEQIKSDAATLERLQGSAQSADGRMQALQVANQLASNQAAQLLQIRSLLIAQQNALAPKLLAEADQEARDKAAMEAALKRTVNMPDHGYTHFQAPEGD
jgi:P-type conjugative transfer protein TrbJ